MKLTSPTFREGGIIPSLYTCEGKNIHPELHISDIPPNAETLVLICEDPDVPKIVRSDGMYDHWILFNIPAHVHILSSTLALPGLHGKNSDGKNQYTGPCPPDREHRYFFKLYALDIALDLSPGATKKEVEKAMYGHIVDECQLMGRYEKGKGY